jgi:hypothetical protein
MKTQPSSIFVPLANFCLRLPGWFGIQPLEFSIYLPLCLGASVAKNKKIPAERTQFKTALKPSCISHLTPVL